MATSRGAFWHLLQSIELPICRGTSRTGSRPTPGTTRTFHSFPITSFTRTKPRIAAIGPRCSPSIRQFGSTSRLRAWRTIEEARSRARIGPLTLKAGVVFIITGTALIIFFREERARVERKKIANATKGIGKPKVGGPFSLVDHNGRPFTQEDLLGKYTLMYFGFTHCPDICPDELDKMAEVIDTIKKKCGDVVMPVMVSCDPARDKPAVLKQYLAEFHPDIIGLTGEYDQIKDMCKVFRVYFSTPPDVKPGQDYLVDHSIYFYLMDPEGDFVEVLGRNFTAGQAAQVVIEHIKDWDGFLDESPRRKAA